MNSVWQLLILALLVMQFSGCAGTRELTVSRPTTATVSVLPSLGNASQVQGDDYYVQLISDFQFNNDGAQSEVCRDIGSGYVKGGTTALMSFQVRNEPLKFDREVPGFIYRSASGRCGFSLEAKKVYLTPWMRLDTGKDTQIDYRFDSSNAGEVDLGRVSKDVDTASNVLALSGVGTGVALMGKLASGWMKQSSQPDPGQTSPEFSIKRRQESHSVPSTVSLSGNQATTSRIVFAVQEIEPDSLNPLTKPKILGELQIYADVKASLLLKTSAAGIPDARDLSLDELLRSSIQTGNGVVSLEKFILEADHPEHPNLQPDWSNYREVEMNCRKLKVVMKDLGFNRFDRNAVLFYFLDKTQDWKNFNLTGQTFVSGDLRPSQLEQIRAKNFGGCLIQDDYETMKSLGLAVNSEQDWTNLQLPVQEKAAYFAAIRSLDRQLSAVIRNSNVQDAERQIYPLISSRQTGNGTVLLQNNLGNFGLESLINVPSVPGQGLIISAAQLAGLFNALKVSDLTCARAVFEQGRPIQGVAILLFSTSPESPLKKGGALEFEFDGGKILRLSFQSPTYRDFQQDVLSHPEIGECRIDPSWLNRI